MRKKLLMLSAVGLALATLSVPAIAQDNAVSSPPSQTEPSAPAANAEERQQKLAERLAARKERRAVRLSLTQSERLKTRCAAAQGKVRSLEGRIQGIQTRRQQAYATLQLKLETVATALAAAGLDVTELNQHIDQFKSSSDDFIVAIGAYKQTVADLGAMDCAADPEAFQASLVEAREAVVSLKSDATDIRTLLTKTIRTTLAELKQSIESTEGAE